MRAWLNAMLSTPCSFHVMKKTIDWEIEQRRETQKVNATLARTTVQHIWDVNMRRQAGKSDKDQLFAMYQANLTTSARSEPVTLTFIERAIYIWDKGTSHSQKQMLPAISKCHHCKNECRNSHAFLVSCLLVMMGSLFPFPPGKDGVVSPNALLVRIGQLFPEPLL